MIALEGVSRSFGDVTGVAGIDLELAPATTTVLIGSSGSGKSTLLRLMVGLIAPDAGTIRFDGEPLRTESLPRLRLRMGYVIQEGGLFPHLTARANVELMARQLGHDAAARAARIEALLELVRLPPEALERHPAQLSGGQRQRVGLMRALMLDPPLLLLDEPLGSLDPMIRAELQADLRGIFERLRKTVVLVTHDLREAAFFADRIVLLRAGRILQDGDLKALVRAPADPFVAQFVRAQRSPLDALQDDT